jgi:hypothetical protein
MIVGQFGIAESNFKLLLSLATQLGADGYGSICNFFEVDPEWRCPCCFRSKCEIARLDKNGKLFCAIHEHHDHFWDAQGVRIPRDGIYFAERQVIGDSFDRFPPTLICNDCNVAEPLAKNAAGTPNYFTFAPHEIASFIIVKNNLPHEVDKEMASKLYASAKPGMEILAQRLTAVARGLSREDGEFEQIGEAALRVLLAAKRRMEHKDEPK